MDIRENDVVDEISSNGRKNGRVTHVRIRAAKVRWSGIEGVSLVDIADLKLVARPVTLPADGPNDPDEA
jgi:hypothetical protein